jgi:serine/threonine-protein kinase
VSGHTPPAESAAIINDLTSNGGWGNSNRFQIDFSFEVLHADATTPRVAWTQTSDFFSPDCDTDPVPLPAVGSIEGETGYACTQDGDCHLLVIDDVNKTLFEMWRVNQVGSTLNGGCLAKWDLLKHYPANLRGDGCTSADAGGFPIAAMLFNADEVAAGHIDHAIRFILPNARIRHGEYVHPATHTTGPTAGGVNAPPYGVRLRLKSSFNVAGLPSEGAKVVARALQKYGMFLSDGGQIALTAQDDRYTTAKWAGLLDSHDLAGVHTSDFEVVDLPTATPLNDCARNP